MPDDDQEIAEVLGHEPIAVSARAVTKGIAVLFGAVVASLFLIAGLMFLFSKLDGGKATVSAPPVSIETPPGVPALDLDQRGSLRTLRARESQLLMKYEWVDAEAGVARIPIRRAMEILSLRGAPSVESGSDERTNP